MLVRRGEATGLCAPRTDCRKTPGCGGKEALIDWNSGIRVYGQRWLAASSPVLRRLPCDLGQLQPAHFELVDFVLNLLDLAAEFGQALVIGLVVRGHFFVELLFGLAQP